MTRNVQRFALVVALLAGAAGSALAWAPPTDEQIAKVGEAINQAYETMGETFDKAKVEAAAKEAMKSIDLSEATAQQIAKLQSTGAIEMAGHRETAEKRLASLAAEPTADGARAAGLMMSFPQTSQPNPGEQAKNMDATVAKLRAALEHPGFSELLKSNEPIGAINGLRMMSLKNAAPIAPIIFALDKHLKPGLGIEPTGSLVTAAMMLAEAEGVDPVAREAFRVKLASIVDESVKTMSEGTPERDRDRLLRRQKTVHGAYMKGQLVNHPCPPMKITWSNLSGDPQSVGDLKGKIVVLDFWATWCGPCIGSFPQVRDLAAHYKGYDVVILGVTSLQGNHYPQSLKEPGRREPIVTKGDPKKEYDLMAGFIKDMDMTWNVAFTEENVFNPDFGVNGIPHVAILDAKGIVRHRGMHPGIDPEHKLELIDNLLKEAGLPTPPKAQKAEKKDEKSGG
jgi:thiol-disulfide isomerase/thioredoxin